MTVTVEQLLHQLAKDIASVMEDAKEFHLLEDFGPDEVREYGEGWTRGLNEEVRNLELPSGFIRPE